MMNLLKIGRYKLSMMSRLESMIDKKEMALLNKNQKV